MAEGADLALPTEEEIDQMKLGKISRLLQKLGMTEDETDDMDKEEARAELKKRVRDSEARKPAEQVNNKQQDPGPLHVDVDIAEVADLPTEEEVDKMTMIQLYLPLRNVGLTDAEIGKLRENDAKAELKKRIRDIQAAAATRRRRAGQAAENLTEVLNKHNSKRERLAELCHRIAVYHPKLSDSIKAQLKIKFDRDAKDILQDVQGHLDKEECYLLVAGETSSGKSTFLNRLLGEDILPVAHMSCTSAICEVKYGETRQAVVHLRQPDDQGQITIPLDGKEEHQQELRSYIHLRGAYRYSLPPAEKIEIFLPLPLLKGGIVLVDSPGVGESDVMDTVVADYIRKYFAFLYIIDSPRGGGVQQDRLGQLLMRMYAAKENAEDFNLESAMFICNKWDLVPPEERDELKSDTFRKLSEMWPRLKEEQVFFVSTRKAVGPFGILSEDFTKVLDGLDLLLPKSLDNKLNTQYRLLSELLSATLSHINVLLNFAMQNIDYETKWKRYEEVKEHLQSFDDQETLGLTELEKVVERNMETMKSFLSEVVETGTLRKDLLAVQKLPLLLSLLIPSYRRVRHQDVLVNFVHDKRGEDFSKLKALYEALANTLAQCPGYKRIVSEWRKIQGLSFIDKLKEVAKSLEKGQQQTMVSITGSSSSMPHMEVTRDALLQTPFLDTIYDRFVGGLTISSLHWPGRWSVAYLLNWEANSNTVSILQNCWDQAQTSTPLVDILMEALKSDDLLTELAERQVQPQRDLMSKMKDNIKKMKDSMDKAIQEAFTDVRGNEEIKKTYEPQSRDINSFLGQLGMFHLTSTKRYEYDLDSITGWTYTRNRLGGGSFGEVFRVQVPWKGADHEMKEAALKIGIHQYDFLTAKTAWAFLKEEDNLRKLQGDHIVEYFGTACKRVKTEGRLDKLRLGLVMELCEDTLEDRIVGQREHNPAWWGDDPEKQAAAFSYTQNLAVQLCEGLKTIHDAGYIHRDLKLGNILVTRNNTVKLADVGLTKRKEDITGTAVGTPVYAAPEVKERKVYDKSADIYSLGLILWEMWYGVPLYGLEDSAYSKEMEERLNEGKDIRMPNWNGSVPPIDEWTSLIHHCLKKNPSERPEIQECLNRIKRLAIDSSKNRKT